jgi:MoaA/NifB/PqqE/SkfB family radical SAM enzyme
MTTRSSNSASLEAQLRGLGIGHRPLEGVSDRVGEIYVMLTWRCNLRCRMCPMWGEHGFCADGDTGEESLTKDDVVAFVRAAEPLRPRAVTLSGGEPLLSETWSDVARALDELGLKVMLTTNGTLLGDVDPALLRPLRQINISIDGPPLVLERLDRGGGETIGRAIRALRSILSSRRGREPHLKLLTVITHEGVGHLVQMLDLFEAEGVTFDSHLFQHQMFLSPGSARSHHDELELLLGPGVPIWEAMVSEAGRVDVDVLLEEIEAIRRRIPDAVFSPRLDPDQVRMYYSSPTWLPGELASHCLSPWLDVGLTPNGDVWLCPGFAVGNVHEQSFDEIWNGRRARALRKRIASGSVFPGCRGCFYLYNYRTIR